MLLLCCLPDRTGIHSLLGRNRGKVEVFKETVHAIASRYVAVVADLWALRQLRDPRMWDPDRLHLSRWGTTRWP
jgi:hypothetical protein